MNGTGRRAAVAARGSCGRRGAAGLAAAGLVLAAAAGGAAGAQVRYDRGQNVVPVYEGWEANPDGTFNLVFGYLNRNYAEHLHVPVGADNFLEPGGIDQGQPTYFFPRRHRFLFRVTVPSDFGGSELVWTLTAHGRTEKAYATLLPDYAIENDMISFDGNAVSNTPRTPGNEPPTLSLVGAARRTVEVGETLSLAAYASDDGLPPPPRDASRMNSRSGLSVTWFVYRGPAETVTFDPEQRVHPYFLPGPDPPPPVPPDGRFEVRVWFSQPGEFVLRATALDGVLWANRDLHVTVKEAD